MQAKKKDYKIQKLEIKLLQCNEQLAINNILIIEKDKKISELEIKLLELSHNQTIPNEFSVLS